MEIDKETLPPGGRWFVSVEPSETVKTDLERLKTAVSGIRWTPFHQFHLTLRFIGEAGPDTVRRIARNLEKIRVEPFILETEGIGCFPSKGRPRILWAGFGSGHPRLFQLRQKVEESIVSAALEPETRRFHPHITLARCGNASPGAIKEFLKTHREHAGAPFRVERFSLFVSRLTSDGAIHEEAEAYPLVPE